MKELWIILGVLLGVIFVIILTSFICFLKVFYSPKRKPLGDGEYQIPEGEIYEPHRESMVKWIEETRAMPSRDMSVTSFDGLTLRGKFYEYDESAPIELMFHGYRGNAERDLCGGVQRCFALGHAALIVNHRASGNSDGSVITFGIKERHDVITWLNYINENIGKDRKIILTGISMGAATVMMASAMDLPENVVGVLADCGYTSARDIIKKTVREMHLPVPIMYPFIKLGARIFGGFDLEETSPIEALKVARVPVLFAHGDTDDFVPWDMSRANFEVCCTQKRLITVPGAGHGLAYPTDKEGYIEALREFFTQYTDAE